MRKLEWRRESTAYIIEIKVGNTWVQHDKKDLEEQAMFEAKKILKDNSVKEVRVLEHSIKHMCHTIFEKEGTVLAAKLPPKMRDTGLTQECPSCATSHQKVATDGSNDWLFCTKCNRAFPV